MELHHHYQEGDSPESMNVDDDSEDTGPPEIGCATANENQRRHYEREVGKYQRRVVRRLHRRADRAEDHSNFYFFLLLAVLQASRRLWQSWVR